MKSATQFHAFRASILADLATLAGDTVPRPALKENATVSDVLEYAETLKRWESRPVSTLPPRVLALAREGIIKKVCDFVEDDTHEFAPCRRPRKPWNCGDLDRAKTAFYGVFLHRLYVVEKMDLSESFIYTEKQNEEIYTKWLSIS